MNRKPAQILRVSPEVHSIAKLKACECKMTLEKWLEYLIKKELQVIK